MVKNLAIIVNHNPIGKETFITNHIKLLPFNITVIHGGDIPYQSESIEENKIAKLYYKIKKTLFSKRNDDLEYQEYALKRILKKKQINTIFSEYLIPGGFVSEICKKNNIKLLSIALGYDISVDSIIKKHIYRYQNLFETSKAILVVSEHMQKKLVSLGCRNDKIIYSPAGADMSFFDIQPSFDNLNLFALGRFVEKKAPHLTVLSFVEVLKIIPNAKLYFGGDGPLLEMCKDIAKYYKIEQSIEFMGRIDQKKQREILQNSILFVQHSKIASNGDSEGTPVSIIEASAAGLPVISTIHAGIPGVIEHSETGLLSQEGDVEQMTKNIIKTLTNIEYAKQMGAKGKKRIQANFSLDRHIQKITSAINSL